MKDIFFDISCYVGVAEILELLQTKIETHCVSIKRKPIKFLFIYKDIEKDIEIVY